MSCYKSVTAELADDAEDSGDVKNYIQVFPFHKLRSYSEIDFDNRFYEMIAGLLQTNYPAIEVDEIFNRFHETGILTPGRTPNTSRITLDVRDDMFRLNKLDYLPLSEFSEQTQQIFSLADFESLNN